MDRRTFIKLTALSGAGLAVPKEFGVLAHAAESAKRPDLVVAHGGSAEQIVKAALDAMGGIQSFISRGDVVVIKPNIGWDRLAEQAANTNPEVVAAVV
ncbi:MAG TPA: cytoplasmic protein, partial [Nitrospirota bacterium]|nr:cytoplasmic protein [Nitrospirota bacterium]